MADFDDRLFERCIFTDLTAVPVPTLSKCISESFNEAMEKQVNTRVGSGISSNLQSSLLASQVGNVAIPTSPRTFMPKAVFLLLSGTWWRSAVPQGSLLLVWRIQGWPNLHQIWQGVSVPFPRLGPYAVYRCVKQIVAKLALMGSLS